MAGYVDPQSIHNPATGVSPSSAWGDTVRDDVAYLAGDAASGNPKPLARVYNSAALTIANNTPTALTFNSERFDIAGMHSTSSNTSRLTVPTGCGGKYRIGAHIQWASNASGNRAVWLYANGATVCAVEEKTPFSGAAISMSVSTLWTLAAGDYVEVYVQQTSGGSLNVNVASAYSPEFWAEWCGVG